jgi:hypothetical protein
MQKSLKIHSLQSSLDFLPTNLSAFIDEHGNRLYQEIFTTDECYQDKGTPTSWLTTTGHQKGTTHRQKASVATFKASSICSIYDDIVADTSNYSVIHFRLAQTVWVTDKC